MRWISPCVWRGRVSVAVLVDEEEVARDQGLGRCFPGVLSVIRLGPPGAVSTGVITLQERGFQEEHTSPALDRRLLS